MIKFIKKIYNGNYNIVLVIGSGLLFVSYSFFIVTTVVSVNARKNIRNDIRQAQARVAELEINYFNLLSHVDKEKATTLGFVETPIPRFAYEDVVPEKVASIR